jgi:hypothetical protein
MEMTMSSRNTHPKWWQVYLTLPLLIALFALDSRLRISIRGHQAVQIGIVLLIYGSIHFWLKANHSALAGEVREQPIKIYRVIEIPPTGSPEFEGEEKSILQFSDSEIHGLLGDDMEMGYTDPELFSYKEIHKN